MSIDPDLLARAGSECELCGSADGLTVLDLSSGTRAGIDAAVLVCGGCHEQIDGGVKLNADHWRCLNGSVWSQVPAVQVASWRMLNRLNEAQWARDLLDQMYMDDETLAWAKLGVNAEPVGSEAVHRDSNGAQLSPGDTVTLIKDLNVKGAGFTAKRGTAVRGISLVADNAKHIEGRVKGQQIVILTKFVKKSS